MSLAAETPTPARKVRPFFWSVRRELWENPSVWIAPLAITAVVLFATLFSLPDLERSIRLAEGEPAAIAQAEARAAERVAAAKFKGPSRLPNRVMTPAERQAKAASALNMHYGAAIGAITVVSWLVAIFYSLNALYAERRDRSVLFWKSMPVSDVTTVAAKAAIPLVAQPLLIVALTIPTCLGIFLLSAATLVANGVDPGRLLVLLDPGFLVTYAPWGLLVNTLWAVPFYGWLFVVSAWARKNTLAWAILPWFALALFDFMVSRGIGDSSYKPTVLPFIGKRIFGGFELAFGPPGAKTGVTPGDIDVGRVLTSLDLWGGLVAGLALFAAAVWLRRSRDPI